MHRHNLKQRGLIEFSLPFQRLLSPENKWVKLASLIPWEKFEGLYRKSFAGLGTVYPALSVRMALAALIIKEELGASDRACAEQVTQNPYLQYFCGLKAFITEPPFDASLFVHFRKRFPADVLTQVNNAIAKKVSERQLPPEDPPPPKMDKVPSSNQGRLPVDATCALTDITYPTDLKFLNKAGEKSECIIDELLPGPVQWSGGPQPMPIQGPAGYQRGAETTEVDVQQSQPAHRRSYREYQLAACSPLKRGNAGSDAEFDANVSISLLDGVSFVDRISWDNFNEGIDPIAQFEAYRERFGFYPEWVHCRVQQTQYHLECLM